MKMSNQTTSAFQQWIGKDTWHTHHPLDMDRFYDFVQSLWNDQYTDIDLIRQNIREEIKELHPNFDPQYRDETIDRRVSEAEHIFSYLRHIEKK